MVRIKVRIRVSIRHLLIKFVYKITSPQFHRWKLVFTSNNVYKAASLASTDDDFQDFDFLSIYI